MTKQRKVYSTYRFMVEIKGITEAAFSECSGLQAETEIFEWQEGGRNGFTHRLPGRTKFSNLTLKRGIASAELWNWFNSSRLGKVKRYDISIILCGYQGYPEVRWNIADAVPIKWNGPTFKADANEVAVESIELIHNGFERVGA
ncbi:MAG TPA: phage tail protein [Herpetosiphonaceae bacterium]